MIREVFDYDLSLLSSAQIRRVVELELLPSRSIDEELEYQFLASSIFCSVVTLH